MHEQSESQLALTVSVLLVCTDVSVTWNGTTVTGPVLIYHDEILVDPGPSYSIGDTDRPGTLVCRSDSRDKLGTAVALVLIC